MSSTPNPSPAEAASHARRAAALLVHYANRDEAGFNAIVSELQTGEDSVRLVLGLLGMFDTAMPMLFTPGGIHLVKQVVAQLAGVEYGGDQ